MDGRSYDTFTKLNTGTKIRAVKIGITWRGRVDLPPSITNWELIGRPDHITRAKCELIGPLDRSCQLEFKTRRAVIKVSCSTAT